MPEKEIGQVIHFFGKAMVAVIKLSDNLRVGDQVKLSYRDASFEQAVDSMEVNHQKIESARSGDEVALKVAGKAHENMKVYKIE